MDNTVGNAINGSPEDIAENIFNEEPKDPDSCQLLTWDHDGEISYLYEVLINVLMYGVCIRIPNIRTIPFDDMDENFLLAFNPWMRSIGFNMNVNRVSREDKDVYKDYYCRIVLNRDKYEMWFQMKHLNKSFHFFLNGHTIESNKMKKNINEIFSIFENKDDIYIISFDHIKPLDRKH